MFSFSHQPPALAGRFRTVGISIALTTLTLLMPIDATADSERDVYTNCLVEKLKLASDLETVSSIRESCEGFLVKSAPVAESNTSVNPGLIGRRVLLEKDTSRNRFALTQHNSSYMLPLTHNGKVNNAPFREEEEGQSLDNTEVKFQFSFKAQLFDAILNDRGRVFMGYTNQSYWQLYDEANSRPFRETNHEPELFLDLDQDLNVGEFHIPLIRLGLVHQSNGRSDPLSRTWNRIYGQVYVEKGNYALTLKPWLQLGGDNSDADNPDIDKYMGNFELGVFRQGETSATSILLRNNLRSDNRGAFQFAWSKPLPYNKKLRFLFQYFYGYGESLVDYDALSNRVGIGLQLSDFL